MFLDKGRTFYYVLDWSGNKVLRYDDNWNFIEYKNYSYPFHMIVVNTSIYIIGEYIYKTDKYLNFIKSGGNRGSIRGIYYNQEDNNIYVAMCLNDVKRIDILNLGLKSVDYIDLSPYLTGNDNTYSIQGYNGYLYVGSYSGVLIILKNKRFIEMFNVCDQCPVTSIFFDQFGYMVAAGYLFYPNKTYTGKSLYVRDINFDSKGRLVVVDGYGNVKVYY